MDTTARQDSVRHASVALAARVTDMKKWVDSAAGVSIPAGDSTMTVKNYLKPGDSLDIGLDSTAKTMRSIQVSSYVEKPKDDDVTLNVTFANLPDGTSYPQTSVLNVTAKKIQVTVTNSGYKKAGS